MTTLIIGAGMAGIAAARELMSDNKRPIILEARDRIGGRIYTDHNFADHPVECGAEFLHGEHVPTWKYVHRLGLKTIHWKRQDDALVRMADGSQLTMSEARRRDPEFDITRTWDIPLDQIPPEDESFENYLRRIEFTEAQLQYVRRAYSNAMSESMQFVSAQGTIENMNRDEMGFEDHRIVEGYDVLMDFLAENLDIRLDTTVTVIDWSGDDIQIKTASGETFTATQVIITLPVGVLKSNRIRFVPELPESKLAALEKLTMGPAIKMLYKFPEPILPNNMSAIYSANNPPMWWSPSYQRDTTTQVWTAFATGDWARELLKNGEESALNQGLETLRSELNNASITPTAMKIINWGDDPYACGGYSAALVGGAKVRSQLALPIDNKLFWAGEATAPNNLTATVHGAYLTGKRAAAEILTS